MIYSLHRSGPCPHRSTQWLSKSIERSGRCRAIASHLDTILLKSKQPSARRSTNCWSSASSRNRRPAPTGDGQWRLTPDFAQLNAVTKVLKAGPFQHTETFTRLGTMKPTCFGLLDFTAGYHQTPLDPASRVFTAFRAAGGLYQWTRVAMGLKGSGPYFLRNLRDIHRRCTHTRQIRSGVPP